MKGVGEQIFWKSVWKQLVGKIRLKKSGLIWQQSCVENWYGTIEGTKCWKNLMTNLVENFYKFISFREKQTKCVPTFLIQIQSFAIARHIVPQYLAIKIHFP